MREAAKEYNMRHQGDGATVLGMEENDWFVLSAYLRVVEPFKSYQDAGRGHIPFCLHRNPYARSGKIVFNIVQYL